MCLGYDFFFRQSCYRPIYTPVSRPSTGMDVYRTHHHCTAVNIDKGPVPFLKGKSEKEEGSQTDQHTGRQTDRDKQTDRWTETDRQTDRRKSAGR